MLAQVINILNDKGLKYKVASDKGAISMVFGVMAQGTKNKVVIAPGDNEIVVKIFEADRNFADEVSFGAFIDKIIELKAIQEQEAKILEDLKKVD